MAKRLRRALMGASVVVVLGSAGCGGGGGEADAVAPTTTEAASPTTEATTSTTAAATEEEAVLAAYQGYWDTWLAANDPPNPDHPDLAKYATGAALDQLRRSISEEERLGQAIRLPEASRFASSASVEEQDLASALVSDCAVDDSKLIDVATGTVLDGEVATFRFHAELHRIGGEWRVESVESIHKWEGIVECAA